MFLERFGYLQPGSYDEGRRDHRTTTALAAYQRFAGLEPSREFDAATREQMITNRCGMPDVTTHFATLGTWERRQLTYAFDIGTPDVPGTGEFEAIRAAFATWAAASGFSFVQVRPYQSPDILVGWRPADDPDRSMVGGLVAHADFPLGFDLLTSSLPKPVHFDTDEASWGVDGSASATDVETITLHEISHILGLATRMTERPSWTPACEAVARIGAASGVAHHWWRRTGMLGAWPTTSLWSIEISCC